jgi:hypothetical protein
MSSQRIIQYLLEDFARCFEDDKNRYKQTELLQLASMLD